MLKTGKFISFFIFVLLLPVLAWSAVTVQSYVDRNEMGMGDTFTLTVSVSSTESVDVSEPRVPQIDGFDLVNSWTSSSTSSKLMQGPGGMQFETVRRQDFQFMLSPKKAGNLSVPAFEVVVEGKTYYTKPIVVKVSSKPTAPQNNQAQGRGRGGAMPPLDEMDEAEQIFNALLQRHGLGRQGQQLPGQGRLPEPEPQLKNLPKNANEALSIKLELDKTDVYEGEQIVAAWYIYTRGQILSLDRVKFPELKGFWKEIIEEVPSLNFTQEIINGVPYRRALLASHALFPIKAGSAVIDEYKVKASVAMPTNPYSAFGFGQAYTYNRGSERAKINVRPLPTEGKPQNFSGAVGQFDIKTSIEGDKFPVGQPFSMKVRFEGSGNAKLIELPELQLPAGIEMYDSKSDSKYFKNGKSFKEFEVLLIPRKEGHIVIPSMNFSIFDPAQRKYVSKKTDPIEITIIENTNGTQSGAGSQFLGQKEKVQEAPLQRPALISDLRAGSSAYASNLIVIWGIVFSGILAFLGFFAKHELAVRSSKTKLKDQVQTRMKKLNALNAKGEWRLVATEMINLYYLVLGQLSGQKGAVTEIQKLLEEAPPSVKREIGSELSKWIEYFQTLGFAPEEIVGRMKEPAEVAKAIAASEKLFEKAIELTESIE